VSDELPSQRSAGLWQERVASIDQPLVVLRAQAPDFPVVYVNDAFHALTGYALRELLGRRPWFLDPQCTERGLVGALSRSLNAGEELVRRATSRRRDGSACQFELSLTPLRDSDGNVTHYVATHRELSSGPTDRTAFPAVDTLVRGPSRRQLLAQKLTPIFARARRGDRLAGIVMIGIDRYDTLSGTFGHVAIDELVRAIAERLGQQLRSEDVVARVGDHQLAIALGSIGSPSDVVQSAQRLLGTFAEAFVVEATEVFVTASMGASVFPIDGDDPTTLLSRAEIALRRAQDRGGNTCNFFTLTLQRRAAQKLSLEMGLRRAVDRRELRLEYQPQLDLATGEVAGMEALLRWRPSGQDQDVSPGQFIPIAEESDLIVSLGEWVLRETCDQIRAWRDTGLPYPRVSINVSARHFRHPSLIQTVRELLKDAQIDAEDLEIELTETALMGDESETLKPLRRLRDMGVRLSIDDFGTGYSSLSYLKRFPIQALKIDRAFVSSIVDDPRDREITRAIVTMAHALGLDAVAEGVETQQQLAVLRELGCDQVQGFLVGRPASPSQIEELVLRPPEESHVRRRVSHYQVRADRSSGTASGGEPSGSS
jgi:diguanylate cyclase (GGDEF)-like protein/PAS domain S-box-containing protein